MCDSPNRSFRSSTLRISLQSGRVKKRTCDPVRNSFQLRPQSLRQWQQHLWSLPTAAVLLWEEHTTYCNRSVNSRHYNPCSCLVTLGGVESKVWLGGGAVLPSSVVVELVEQAVGEHGAVLVDEDLLAAVDADQQADDVRGTPLGARLVWSRIINHNNHLHYWYLLSSFSCTPDTFFPTLFMGICQQFHFVDVCLFYLWMQPENS